MKLSKLVLSLLAFLVFAKVEFAIAQFLSGQELAVTDSPEISDDDEYLNYARELPKRFANNEDEDYVNADDLMLQAQEESFRRYDDMAGDGKFQNLERPII